jgi:hypothetical protein
MLFRQAYALGLIDALGSPERVNAVAASIFESGESMSVSLDAPSPLGLPSTLGLTEVEVASSDSVIGRVVAIGPGEQWDWESVTKRVVRDIGEDIQRAVILRELDRVDAQPVEGLRTGEGVGHGR